MHFLPWNRKSRLAPERDHYRTIDVKTTLLLPSGIKGAIIGILIPFGNRKRSRDTELYNVSNSNVLLV